MLLTESPRTGGEILRKGKHLAAVYRAIAGNDSVRRNIDFIQSKQSASVLDKHVQFTKTTRVKKMVKPLAGSHLTAFMLCRHSLCPTHLLDFRFALSQFFDLVGNPSHFRFSSRFYSIESLSRFASVYQLVNWAILMVSPMMSSAFPLPLGIQRYNPETNQVIDISRLQSLISTYACGKNDFSETYSKMWEFES